MLVGYPWFQMQCDWQDRLSHDRNRSNQPIRDNGLSQNYLSSQWKFLIEPLMDNDTEYWMDGACAPSLSPFPQLMGFFEPELLSRSRSTQFGVERLLVHVRALVGFDWIREGREGWRRQKTLLTQWNEQSLPFHELDALVTGIMVFRHDSILMATP